MLLPLQICWATVTLYSWRWLLRVLIRFRTIGFIFTTLSYRLGEFKISQTGVQIWCLTGSISASGSNTSVPAAMLSGGNRMRNWFKSRELSLNHFELRTMQTFSTRLSYERQRHTQFMTLVTRHASA